MTQCDIGMVGLGVMGSNLVLNIADHGFAVAGLDQSQEHVQILQQEAQERAIYPTTSVRKFIDSLKTPRAIMLLVPAGPPVDAVIEEFLPLLSAGDVIIDGGNSHFTDTNRRQAMLAGTGITLLGMGVSGGESGARHGPCMMPGGEKAAYERVRPIFTAAAAKVNDEACIAYMGPGSAGHYVKMVHNGIEYGLMQLLAETYDVMKQGMGMDNDALYQQFSAWNDTAELNSFLVEITAHIFLQQEPQSKHRLLDLILDEARQKGTGAWTSEDAFNLQVPTPTIDSAVSFRDLSVDKSLRQMASQVLFGPEKLSVVEPEKFLEALKKALHAAMILTYCQGMALLAKASVAYQYQLDLQEIAKIWRGGCIIRSAMLDHIAAAFEQQVDLSLFILNPYFAQILSEQQNDLRTVITAAINMGLPMLGFTSALSYYDCYRSAWLPANMIQAQRDYFGSHTYERLDQSGIFHTKWD